jgi:OPA family sugar phosphate sensor protein UhpC-like MFS transporter
LFASILHYFKPDPFLPEVKDQKEVDRLYKHWRIRILYSTFIGYALYYFSRKSMVFAMPGIIEDLHLTKGELGILGSVMALTYGISKFASGVLSDRSNPRAFMATGLFLTGILNIFFGLSSSLWFFAVLWGLNGLFQGFGWPPCARFLTHWYSHSERGSWWSTWNVSHNTGSFLIPWVVAICLYYSGWRTAMIVPGIICIFGGFFLLNRLRDTPQSLGLPPIEQYRDDYNGMTKEEVMHERELTTKEILFDHVLKNPYIWLLAFAYFFVYVVRTAVSDWSALYLIEEKGYSRLGAFGIVSLFEVGGFAGSLCAGWASDWFFDAKRGPVNILFSLSLCLSLLLFWLVPAGWQIFDTLAIFLLGFSVFGPQMLIGVAAAELSHKKASATSTGFVGWMAYIGAACAGGPLGMIAEQVGWQGYFFFIGSCAVCAFVLLLPLWNAEKTIEESGELQPAFAPVETEKSG